MSIIVSGIGPSLVGDCVYALHRPGALCLYSGTCGGLDETLQIGDYVVAAQAVCGDGYSTLFGRASFTLVGADEDVRRSLGSTFRAIGKRITECSTFTTASVVRENDSDFWDLVDAQCKAIEMGCASFYVAAERSDKRACAYFFVVDLPTRGKSFFDPLSPEELAIKQDAYRNMVSLDLSILSRM